ncbi:MAG: AP2 domain-containing protein [Phycisphaerae bacterium]|jgi:hypothetical protein
MKEIALTQDKNTIVDDECFEWLNQWKWCAKRDRNTFYAARHETKEEYLVDGRNSKQRKTILMHRAIIERKLGRKLEYKEEIDHEDHNGLNNQENNLRICTKQENQFNQKSKRGVSEYKGVHLDKETGKWVAKITINGKNKHLGLFDDETLAAVAYNKAAVEYFGEFAYLNEGPELDKYTFEDIDKLRYKGNGSSKYKGVSWKESNHKWRAFIYINGKHVHLGYFTKEEDAALAYNSYVLEKGLNKKLNIIEGGL